MAVYVYAIVPRTVRLSRGRRAAARLRVVRGRSAAAIVADRRRPPAPDARALAAHDRVVRRIARDVPALLPVRFGTMFDDDPAVAARLTPRIADWGGALRAVARREQMTLRVFGAPMAAPPRTARAGPPATGTAYLRERAGTLARAREAPELAPLRAALGPLLADERVTRHDRGALRLTAYHLIARGSARAYRRALARVTAAPGVRMLASGPWPPYAFAPEVGR